MRLHQKFAANPCHCSQQAHLELPARVQASHCQMLGRCSLPLTPG